MRQFNEIYMQVLDLKGSDKKNIEKGLPKPLSKAKLKKISDDRYMAEMTKCIFRSGFVWRVIDAKWDGFEEAFFQFNPNKLALLSDEQLEKYTQDARIVRNFQKIKTVRENAGLILSIQKSHQSFSNFIAEWPCSNLNGLFDFLKKEGNRLGGNTGQYFLRFMGKDTFIFSNDVISALHREKVIDRNKAPGSKRDKQAIQDAFNIWHEESGKPYCQISRLLAMSVG